MVVIACRLLVSMVASKDKQIGRFGYHNLPTIVDGVAIPGHRSESCGRPLRTRGAHDDRSTLARRDQRRGLSLGPGSLRLPRREGQPLGLPANGRVLLP